MLEWKLLGPDDEYEAANTEYDFHIYHDPDEGHILDVYDINDKDDESAHLDSIKCESIQDAQNRAASYRYVSETVS